MAGQNGVRRDRLKRVAMAGVAAIAVVPGLVLRAVPAMAQDASAERTISFDIPAGSVRDALRAYADATGLQLVYNAELDTAGASAGVSGSMTAQAALARLLAGTGLTYRFANATTVTIESAVAADGTRVLGAVRVEGAQGGGYAGAPQRGEGVAQLGGVRGNQDQEERGLRPVVAAVGSGAPTALEDIPRSVSVITQTQIEAQDITDIGEAIRRMPGVSFIERTSSTGSNVAASGGQVYARGQQIGTVQIDGGAPRYLDVLNNGLLNLAAYERIELLRGPNGVFGGPNYGGGGSINLVRKRPGSDESFSLTGTVGSYDRYAVLADYSTPSLFGSAIAFRGVASYDDQRFKWANDHLRRTALYGIFDAPLGDNARLEVGVHYQDVKQNGYYQSIYRYLDGPVLDTPFYFNYTPEWSFIKISDTQIFSRLFVGVAEDIDFDAGISYSSISKDSLDSVINGRVYLLSTTKAALVTCNSAGVCTPRRTSFFARRSYRPSEQLSFDFRMAGRFSTGFLDHNFYVAGDLAEQVSPSYVHEFGGFHPSWTTIYSLADFIQLPNFAKPNMEEGSELSAISDKGSSSSLGFIINDVISFDDWLFLNLSLRYSDSESSYGTVRAYEAGYPEYSINLDEEFSGFEEAAGHWLPSWAISVKPWQDLTLYGSYSQGSYDQSRYETPSGAPLGPATYQNTELGLKYGAHDWLFSLAGYRLERSNTASAIPGSQGQCGPTPTSSCYFLEGDTTRSQGFDIELQGRLFNQLDLQLSYNYDESETLSSSLPINSQLPAQQAKAFIGWYPPFLPGLSINAGAVYRARIYDTGETPIFEGNPPRQVAEVEFEYEEPAHVVIDLGADYQLNDNWKASLLVENVTDKKYYSTVTYYVNHVGNPRTATFRLVWTPRGRPQNGGLSPTTGLAPFGDPANWYAAFDAGMGMPSDIDAESTGLGSNGEPIRWEFDTNSDWTAFARLGYRFRPTWRGELEASTRNSDFASIGGSDMAPFGVCSIAYSYYDYEGTLAECRKPQGDMTSWAFRFNVLHDFAGPDAAIQPFVGAGVGAIRNSVDFSGRLDGVVDTVYRDFYTDVYGPLTGYAPGEKVLAQDVRWAFSWQVLGGVGIRLNDRAKIDLTYRYTRDDFSVETANLQDYPDYSAPSTPIPGSGSPLLKSFEGEYGTHAFTVGFRWAFGSRK